MVMTFEETKQLEILKHENDMKELKYRNELDTAFDNQKTENQLKVLQKQKEIAEIQASAVQAGVTNVEIKDPMKRY